MPQAPNPEVKPKGKRRVFPAAYKLGILSEVERCSEAGAIGALLRREGRYASHLSTWRRPQAVGELMAGAAKQRGRKSTAATKAVAKLRQENERLRRQLAQAELLISAQKKLAQVLENALCDENGRPSCKAPLRA